MATLGSGTSTNHGGGSGAYAIIKKSFIERVQPEGECLKNAKAFSQIQADFNIDQQFSQKAAIHQSKFTSNGFI